MSCSKFAVTFVEHQGVPFGTPSTVVQPQYFTPFHIKGNLQGFLLLDLASLTRHDAKISVKNCVDKIRQRNFDFSMTQIVSRN